MNNNQKSNKTKKNGFFSSFRAALHGFITADHPGE